MKNTLAIGLISMLALSSCIGTDIKEELDVPEEVAISTAIDSLAIGDSFSFAADHFDDFGERTGESIIWSSSDESIISINDTGLATALSPGNVYVRAWVGSTGDSVRVNAGQTTSVIAMARRGTLQGANNYRVVGSFSLTDQGDNLELTLSDDFSTSSGPGLYVYLSNSSRRVTGGLEVGRLGRRSGAQTYTISKSDAQLNTFSHIVIYCKPFGLAFGFGAFEN
jgi:hypothetical protein